MSTLRSCLLGAIVWSAGVLSLSSLAAVPWWDANPLLSDLPQTALTPGQVLLICAVALLAGTGLLIDSARRNQLSSTATAVIITFGVGAIGVILHGANLVPIQAAGGDDNIRGELQNLVVGSTWIAALIAAIAVSVSQPRQQTLRMVLGVFVVLITLMIAKGLFERFVEYPRTLTHFEANRESILLANGIEPGSVNATIYERRLRGLRPTAWFGLTNVLASFLAATIALLAGSFYAAAKQAKARNLASGSAGIIALLTVAAAFTLTLTGSLGAIGATLMVAALATTALFSTHIRRAFVARPGLIAIGLGLTVLAGIAARGLLLPESLERSVLFRWHYLIGTTRILAERTALGTGPAGFQAAYTRLKPAGSPENVQTPHILIADWLGTFGIVGAIVLIGLLWWGWSAGRTAPSAEPAEPTASHRMELRWCLITAASIVITAAYVQWGVLAGVLDLLMVLGLGLLVAVVSLTILLRVWSHHPKTLACCAAAMAGILIAHAMFDVTPARPSAAILFWLVIGCGLPLHAIRPVPRAATMAVVLLATMPLTILQIRVGWRMTTKVEPLLAEFSRSVRNNLDDFDPHHQPDKTPPDRRRPQTRFYDSIIAQTPVGWLDAEILHARMLAATLSARIPDQDDHSGWMSFHAERWPGSVSLASLSATAAWSRHRAASQDETLYWLSPTIAINHATRAAQLAPHDPQPAYRVFSYLQASGQSRLAENWARRALQNNRIADLDPLAGLSEDQIAHLRSVLSGSP